MRKRRRILCHLWKNRRRFYTESLFNSPKIGTYIRIHIDGVSVHYYIESSVCKLDQGLTGIELLMWDRYS